MIINLLKVFVCDFHSYLYYENFLIIKYTISNFIRINYYYNKNYKYILLKNKYKSALN